MSDTHDIGGYHGPMDTPQTEPVDTSQLEYAGFWIRTWAAVIDSILVGLVTLPLLAWFYGGDYWDSEETVHGVADVLISWVFPAVAIVWFWIARQATPGKMAIGARIVDARTGGKCTTGQLLLRYLGYFAAMIPFFIGILWVAFDSRKQGWQDKIAGTVVVRRKGGNSAPVKFDGPF